MKRKYLHLLTVLLVFLLASCVGQPERLFPWEEETEQEEQETKDSSRCIICFDFTATWCINCPAMADAIDELKKVSDTDIVPVSVHYLDDFSGEASMTLTNYFGINVFPTVVMDFNPEARTSLAALDVLCSIRDDLLTLDAPTCKIDAGIIKTDKSYQVDASIFIDTDGRYLAGAMLVKDGIVAPQSGGSDNYVHDNVLISFLNHSFPGDALDQIDLDKHTEVSFDIPPLTDPDNYGVILYVIENHDGGIRLINSTRKLGFPL